MILKYMYIIINYKFMFKCLFKDYDTDWEPPIVWTEILDHNPMDFDHPYCVSAEEI